MFPFVASSLKTVYGTFDDSGFAKRSRKTWKLTARIVMNPSQVRRGIGGGGGSLRRGGPPTSGFCGVLTWYRGTEVAHSGESAHAAGTLCIMSARRRVESSGSP